MESLNDTDGFGGIAVRDFHNGFGKFFVVVFELCELGDEFVLLFTHPFEFFLHDGVLVDDRVLGLKLVIVALFVFFLDLKKFCPG